MHPLFVIENSPIILQNIDAMCNYKFHFLFRVGVVLCQLSVVGGFVENVDMVAL